MSPEQLKKLHELSQLFEQGNASHAHIRKLNEILSQVNSQHVSVDLNEELKSEPATESALK